MALGVAAEEFVEQRIADLVSHLVGMTLGNTFGSEEITHNYTTFNC